MIDHYSCTRLGVKDSCVDPNWLIVKMVVQKDAMIGQYVLFHTTWDQFWVPLS